MNPTNILTKLVKFNTIKDKENDEILSYVESLLSPYGFEFKRVKKNLIAIRGKNPQIGFLGHTDTVNSVDGYDTDPFILTKVGDKLFGLGTCDMKGGIAAFLAAAIATTDPVKLYLTSDEEINLTGVQDIIKSGEIFPELLIIAEPSDESPVVATKGPLELRITFRGVRVHSSRPDTGKSAIYDCAEFIGRLRAFGESLKNEPDETFDPPFTTYNVGLIKGGDMINATPAKCEISIDFRIVDETQRPRILKTMNKLLAPYDAELKIGLSIPPFKNPSDISRIENLTCRKSSMAGFTEASYIGDSCVILGPAPNTAHEKNEYVSEKSLDKMSEVYKQLIKENNDEN